MAKAKKKYHREITAPDKEKLRKKYLNTARHASEQPNNAIAKSNLVRIGAKLIKNNMGIPELSH